MGGSAAVCHLLLQTSVLAAFHAGELSVLPPSIPPAAPPSLSPPRMSLKWVCRLQADVRNASVLSGCRAASSPSLVPGQPDLQASGELTGVPGLRKPNRDKVYIGKADPVSRVSLHCTATILANLMTSFVHRSRLTRKRGAHGLGHLGTFSTFTWPAPALPTPRQIRLKERELLKGPWGPEKTNRSPAPPLPLLTLCTLVLISKLVHYLHNGEKTASSTKGNWGTSISARKRMKSDPYLIPHIKINSQ